jgi:putative PLP-dependent aminotransferase (TIGR04422 family)
MRTKPTGDIWFKEKGVSIGLSFAKSESIEKFLEKNFNSGYPVVFSSGRAAMSFALKFFYKDKYVKLFPFASQCVVKSVLSAGLIPVTPLDYSRLDIAYHQWGKLNGSLMNAPFIEDAVDSFYPLHSNPLRQGGRFEVWSLSKILGLNSGAILWCRDRHDAEKAKEILNTSTSYLKNMVRYSSRRLMKIHKAFYSLWEDLEHKHLPLFSFEYGTIMKKISKWESAYKERLECYLTAINQLGLDSEVYDDKFGGVIPVVIELPNTLSDNSVKDIWELHQIINGDRPFIVSIFPYQVVTSD